MHKCQKSPSSKSEKKLNGCGKPAGNLPTHANPVDSPPEALIAVDITTKINADGMNFAYCLPGMGMTPFIQYLITSRKAMQQTANIMDKIPAFMRPNSRQITPDWKANAEPYAAIF